MKRQRVMTGKSPSLFIDNAHAAELLAMCIVSCYVHITCLERFVQIDTNNLFDEELNSFVIPDDARASTDPKFILNLCPTCLEPYNHLFSVRLMKAYAARTKEYSEFDNRRIHAYLTYYGAFLRPQDPEASKRILLKEVLEKIREFPRDHPGIEETIQCKFTARFCNLLMLAETCRDMGDMAGAMLCASRARDFGNDVYDPEDPFMQLLLE